MGDLWNPSKEEAADISRGQRKERLYHAKQAGAYLTDCPGCGKQVYYSPADDKFFLSSGGEHKCMGNHILNTLQD